MKRREPVKFTLVAEHELGYKYHRQVNGWYSKAGKIDQFGKHDFIHVANIEGKELLFGVRGGRFEIFLRDKENLSFIGHFQVRLVKDKATSHDVSFMFYADNKEHRVGDLPDMHRNMQLPSVMIQYVEKYLKHKGVKRIEIDSLFKHSMMEFLDHGYQLTPESLNIINEQLENTQDEEYKNFAEALGVKKIENTEHFISLLRKKWEKLVPNEKKSGFNFPYPITVYKDLK